MFVLLVMAHATEDSIVTEETFVTDSGSTWDDDVEELLQEDTSDDEVDWKDEELLQAGVETGVAEPEPEDKLASLEKSWKVKEQLAQKSAAKEALKRQKKLSQDMAVEKGVKAKVQLQAARLSQPLEEDLVQTPEVESAEQTALSETKSELDSSKASVAKLENQIQKQKKEYQTKLKQQKAEETEAAEKEIAATEKTMRAKVDKANQKLIEEHKREASMVAKVVEDRSKAEKTKDQLVETKLSKDKHKKTEAEAQTEAAKWKKKFDKENALRKKAVAIATALGQKIQEIGTFGNRSAAYAKAEALRAEKASADAKDNIALMRAREVKAATLASELNATTFELKQKLAEAEAHVASATAEGVHQKALRGKVELLLGTMNTKLNGTLTEKLEVEAQLATHKEKESALMKEVDLRKEEEAKALDALKKVETIKKALADSHTETERYRNENKLQRMELATAAMQEIKAANVTKTAAQNAETIMQQAFAQREDYKKLMIKWKSQLKQEHDLRMAGRTKYATLLTKAGTQLATEHAMRVLAEKAKGNFSTLVDTATTRNVKLKAKIAQIKATAAQIAADRDQLAQRTKAATQMIVVEQEATEEAKKAGQDLQMANEKKLAEMKAQYDALLKKEHDQSVKAQAIATTVTDRSDALKAAIAQEREVLKNEQAKAQDEHSKWTAALAAFKKERTSHLEGSAASDLSHQAMYQKAQLEIQKAKAMAADKDKLLQQVQAQLKQQATTFTQSSSDWTRVKASLMMRVKQAEQAAADANSKVAEMTAHTQQDSAASAAENAVDAALHKTKADAQKMPLDAGSSMMEFMQEDQLEEFAEEGDDREDMDDGLFMKQFH